MSCVAKEAQVQMMEGMVPDEMSFSVDPTQKLGVTAHVFADDEETRQDVVPQQQVQDQIGCARCGTVIERQRDTLAFNRTMPNQPSPDGAGWPERRVDERADGSGDTDGRG